MPTPWDSISQMPWFQNMMRSRQGSVPGNMMSQMNRGQQFGNMRSNPLAGMPPSPPAIGNQPPPNPPAGTLAPGGTPPPNPPAGFGAPPGIMSPPNPPAGLGALNGAGMSGDAGPMVNDAGPPQIGPPTQPGPSQVSPQVGPTSGMTSSTPTFGSSYSMPPTGLMAGRPMPYKHGGAVEPTDGQKKAGNYKKRHITVHGLDISIENEKGSIRSGKDKDGKPWSVKMPAPYGYILGTVGKDKDHVDVYVGPHIKSRRVWVIDQRDHQTKRFDEHKAFLGFAGEGRVRRTYEAAFNDGKGRQRIGHLREMSVEEFKKWLKDGNTTQPIERAA